MELTVARDKILFGTEGETSTLQIRKKKMLRFSLPVFFRRITCLFNLSRLYFFEEAHISVIHLVIEMIWFLLYLIQNTNIHELK